MVRYTYQTVLSGDRNRAKLSFYNMLAKGVKLNPEKYGNIAVRVTGN